MYPLYGVLECRKRRLLNTIYSDVCDLDVDSDTCFPAGTTALLFSHLLGLLLADVGTTQHGSLHCGQDLELGTYGRDALAHLNQAKYNEMQILCVSSSSSSRNSHISRCR